MLKVFKVQCAYEQRIQFVEGPGVTCGEAVLIVYARDEERARSLVSDFGKVPKGREATIDIKKIENIGETIESKEIVMLAYSNETSRRLL